MLNFGGLGTPHNLETAYAYFVTAASSNDPLGHNGLGYIYFRGTNAQAGRRDRLLDSVLSTLSLEGRTQGPPNSDEKPGLSPMSFEYPLETSLLCVLEEACSYTTDRE